MYKYLYYYMYSYKVGISFNYYYDGWIKLTIKQFDVLLN